LKKSETRRARMKRSEAVAYFAMKKPKRPSDPDQLPKLIVDMTTGRYRMTRWKRLLA